jgi:hypothetical protein
LGFHPLLPLQACGDMMMYQIQSKQGNMSYIKQINRKRMSLVLDLKRVLRLA